MNAKHDENTEFTPLAVTDDVNLTLSRLLCDPILDYLEIDVAVVSSHTDFVLTPKEDENYEYVQLATDEVTLEPKTLKVDASNGRLIIDLTII